MQLIMLRKYFRQILEDNTAGAGGVFGQETGHGGESSSDFYATRDARVAKVLGVTQTRNGSLSAQPDSIFSGKKAK